MAQSWNEGKACDAVLRLLEAECGCQRSNVFLPELTGKGPPVDLRCDLGGVHHALEHTEVEAFAGQIRTAEVFGTLIEPVISEMDGTLPKPGVYSAYFPTDTRIGLKPIEMDAARANLKAWILENAVQLHRNCPEKIDKKSLPHGHVGTARGTPVGVPFEIALSLEIHWSRSGKHDGVLIPSRIAPKDVETRRQERLGKALDRKCPKLVKCKEEGAATILILENNDIALSNHVLIGEALAQAIKECADPPDRIYLVDTTVKDWTVWHLNSQNGYEPDEKWHEFNVDGLDDVTANG